MRQLSLRILGFIALVSLCSCGGGSSGSATNGTTTVAASALNACSGVPECVAVTSAEALKFGSEANEMVNLECPVDHPNFWSWGYESTAAMEALLFSTDSPIAGIKGSGANISVKRSGQDSGLLSYQVYLACSSLQQKPDDVATALSTLEGETPQSVALATSTVLQEQLASSNFEGGSLPHGSYVGEKVWEYMTAKSDTDLKYKGITYDFSTTNLFDPATFILQTPRVVPNATGSEYYFSNPVTCPDPSRCSKQFKLPTCNVNEDCAPTGGNCQSVASTVTIPGMTPQKLCLRPQDVLWDQVYKVMVTGKHLVDVTGLNQASQAPDGRFKEAIRNAVTFLANSGEEVKIRLLLGHWYGLKAKQSDVRNLLIYLTQDAKSVANSKISMYVGAYYSAYVASTWDLMSLNHSKIVAADGKVAVIGGENMFDDDYLSINPASDMTLKVSGPAVYDAQAFATRLWQYVVMAAPTALGWNDAIHYFSWTGGSADPLLNTNGYAQIPATVTRDGSAPGTTAVFAVGRLGKGIILGRPVVKPYQSSDFAFLGMIDSAKTSIRIAQQDLIWGPAAAEDIEYWVWQRSWYNQPAMELLAKKLANDVDVYVIVSNLWSKTGVTKAGSYYNGLALARVGEAFKFYLDKNRSLSREKKLDILCNKLHVANIRVGQNDSWSNKMPFANHSKTIIIDKQAFYVGSHNFYPMDLQEYGLVVDDQTLTTQYIDDYWTTLWNNSKRSAITGSDNPNACMFK